jgi:hypothetical protein
MWLVADPLREHQRCRALAMNSGPLSQRMWVGAPRSETTCCSTATVSPPRSTAALASLHVQALLAPDPPHPLAVHPPALPAKDHVLLAVAEAAVPCGERVQAGPQTLLVGDEAPVVPLGGAMLTGRGTGPALRDPETFLQAMDRPPAALGD